MNLIFLINGESGVGKDTLIKHVSKHLHEIAFNLEVHNYHRSDLAKNALKTLGWDNSRDEETRKLLADIVDWMETKGLLKTWEDSILRPRDGLNITFYHVRDPKRFKDLREKYEDEKNTWIYTILVERDLNADPNEIDRWGVNDGKCSYDLTIKLPPSDWKRSHWIYEDVAYMMANTLLRAVSQQEDLHNPVPKPPKRVYISGKITGTMDFREKFKKVEDHLKSEHPDWIVVNPADVELPKICGWEDYMVICLHLLKSCDSIYMLPDWESSKGAEKEYQYAETNGLEVNFVEEVWYAD